MSICGLIIQSLTRNRFVSPTTAGTMDGARLGILVSMLVMGSANLFWRTFFAFAFTLLTTLKEQAEKMFGDFGMNLSTAFDIFARQSLRQGKIPFADAEVGKVTVREPIEVD